MNLGDFSWSKFEKTADTTMNSKVSLTHFFYFQKLTFWLCLDLKFVEGKENEKKRKKNKTIQPFEIIESSIFLFLFLFHIHHQILDPKTALRYLNIFCFMYKINKFEKQTITPRINVSSTTLKAPT